jgi:hypothetical protein
MKQLEDNMNKINQAYKYRSDLVYPVLSAQGLHWRDWKVALRGFPMETIKFVWYVICVFSSLARVFLPERNLY